MYVREIIELAEAIEELKLRQDEHEKDYSIAINLLISQLKDVVNGNVN